MLADVGMVKTYSKSAHANDLGFAWTGPPPCCMDQLAPSLCMDRPSSLLHGPTGPLSLHGSALLLVPAVFLPGGFAIPCRYTLHYPYICPLFLEETFLHTLVSLLFMECKLHMGRSTFKASKQQWQQRDIL